MSKKSKYVTKLTFYEQVGIIIPGTVLLFGLLFYIPMLRELLAKDGVSVGQFGVFVLLSYAAGHLVAALGNAIETMMWKPLGGMPTDWVTRADQTLLSPQQVNIVEDKVRSMLGLPLEAIRNLDGKV